MRHQPRKGRNQSLGRRKTQVSADCVLFTQPPMRRMRICFTDVFFCFFLFFVLFFSVRHKNTRQPFSGTAERIFMKLLPNNSGDNGVCIGIPKWGLGPRLIFGGLKTTHCALGADAWRTTQNLFMLVRYCTAFALKMHERVNAFYTSR